MHFLFEKLMRNKLSHCSGFNENVKVCRCRWCWYNKWAHVSCTCGLGSYNMRKCRCKWMCSYLLFLVKWQNVNSCLYLCSSATKEISKELCITLHCHACSYWFMFTQNIRCTNTHSYMQAKRKQKQKLSAALKQSCLPSDQYCMHGYILYSGAI